MDINTLLRGASNGPSKGLTPTDANATRKNDVKTDNSTATIATSANEKVTITNTASRLSQLTQQANEKPEVNSRRVAELRAAISEGSYKPNPTAIAARLLSFENLLKG